MSGGWIKLHRSIRDNWVWKDPVILRAWIDILLLANHDANKVPIKGRVMEIRRGQFWTSIRKLATRWGMNERTVIKRLDMLQSDGMISLDKQVGYGTLITVCNYCTFQDIPADKYNREYNREYNTDTTESTTENTYKQEYKRISKNELRNKEEPAAPLIGWGGEPLEE